MTKTVTTKPSFQGDVMLMRVEELPRGTELRPVAPENGVLIVAHSETGHHHVIENSRNAQLLIDETNALLGYLVVTGDGVELKHLRDFDTHETAKLPKGVYQMRLKRAFGPEGWRRDED